MREKLDVKSLINRLLAPKGKREMKLSPSFRQFLQRYLDLRDSVITKELAEIIAAQNYKLFDALDKINTRLDSLNKRLDEIDDKLCDHEKRLKVLEKKMV